MMYTNICNFQAEHGPDSQVVLVVAGDGVNISAIENEISQQCQNLPRGEFAAKALSHSFIVFARDMVEVGAFSLSSFKSCLTFMIQNFRRCHLNGHRHPIPFF